MLYITKGLKASLIDHCREELPNEACGILAGKDGEAKKFYKIKNTDKSQEAFFMDPGEQIKAMKDMRESGLDFIAIYHSHPETRAYPSAHDVRLAFYPEASYLIISLQDKDNPEARSFKIADGRISEEEVRIYAKSS